MGWVNIYKTGEPIPESVQRAMEGKYTMQEGQPRPVAEMSNEEIYAHDCALDEKATEAEEAGDIERASKLIHQMYFGVTALDYKKLSTSLEEVCRNFDVSPAVKEHGKEWLEMEWRND